MDPGSLLFCFSRQSSSCMFNPYIWALCSPAVWFLLVPVHDFPVLDFSVPVSSDSLVGVSPDCALLVSLLSLYPRLCLSFPPKCISLSCLLEPVSLSSSPKPVTLSSMLRQTTLSGQELLPLTCLLLFFPELCNSSTELSPPASSLSETLSRMSGLSPSGLLVSRLLVQLAWCWWGCGIWFLCGMLPVTLQFKQLLNSYLTLDFWLTLTFYPVCPILLCAFGSIIWKSLSHCH